MTFIIFPHPPYPQCVFVCVFICVFVCRCMYTCVYTCVETREQLQESVCKVPSTCILFSFFWGGVFDLLRTSNQAKPMSSRPLGTLCLHLLYAGITDEPVCLHGFSWVLGTGLRLSKHFTDWEITSLPAFLFEKSKDDGSLNGDKNEERRSVVSQLHGNNCVI